MKNNNIKISDREKRIDVILSACDSFDESAGIKLAMGFSFFDLFMEQFSGELQNIYAEIPNSEVKEDVKILIDHLYAAKDNHYKEFLAGVILHMVRMV